MICRVGRVIQIRDVPEDVHDALTEAARSEGLSLSAYARRELERSARRAQRVRENASVVRRTQQRVGAVVDRETILTVLHEGRGH
jgi:hypothetical protein